MLNFALYNFIFPRCAFFSVVRASYKILLDELTREEYLRTFLAERKSLRTAEWTPKTDAELEKDLQVTLFFYFVMLLFRSLLVASLCFDFFVSNNVGGDEEAKKHFRAAEEAL